MVDLWCGLYSSLEMIQLRASTTAVSILNVPVAFVRQNGIFVILHIAHRSFAKAGAHSICPPPCVLIDLQVLVCHLSLDFFLCLCARIYYLDLHFNFLFSLFIKFQLSTFWQVTRIKLSLFLLRNNNNSIIIH